MLGCTPVSEAAGARPPLRTAAQRASRAPPEVLAWLPQVMKSSHHPSCHEQPLGEHLEKGPGRSWTGSAVLAPFLGVSPNEVTTQFLELWFRHLGVAATSCQMSFSRRLPVSSQRQGVGAQGGRGLDLGSGLDLESQPPV